MRTRGRVSAIMVGTVLSVVVWAGSSAGPLAAKEKPSQIGPDDPTVRLYALLDAKYNGKLDDFCVLADTFNDPKNPGQQQQHVLRVEYSKDRAFGKLRIYVRAVGQVTPAQLKAYTIKQIYDFGETDLAKFTKTDPGPFGRPGDVYFETGADGSTEGTQPITPELQTQYDHFVTQFLIPALEKKPEASGT